MHLHLLFISHANVSATPCKCFCNAIKSPFRVTERTFRVTERPFKDLERTFRDTERRILFSLPIQTILIIIRDCQRLFLSL